VKSIGAVAADEPVGRVQARVHERLDDLVGELARWMAVQHALAGER